MLLLYVETCESSLDDNFIVMEFSVAIAASKEKLGLETFYLATNFYLLAAIADVNTVALRKLVEKVKYYILCHNS